MLLAEPSDWSIQHYLKAEGFKMNYVSLLKVLGSTLLPCRGPQLVWNRLQLTVASYKAAFSLYLFTIHFDKLALNLKFIDLRKSLLKLKNVNRFHTKQVFQHPGISFLRTYSWRIQWGFTYYWGRPHPMWYPCRKRSWLKACSQISTNIETNCLWNLKFLTGMC